MRVTDEMVEAAVDAMDEAVIASNKDKLLRKIVWRGFTRDDRCMVVRAALEAALSHAAGQEVVGALSRGVPEGMVMVPRVPTDEMETAHRMYGDTSDWWQAVIAAAIAAQRKEGE